MAARTYQATGEATCPKKKGLEKTDPITSKCWEVGMRQEGGGGVCSSYDSE